MPCAAPSWPQDLPACEWRPRLARDCSRKYARGRRDTNEDQPFITPDGSELWFTGQSRQGQIGPAVFRCRRGADGAWGAPEEIVSCLAGEPTLDAAGNLYFIHHYYSADMAQMIEADVYVAYRK